jgi:membrane-bound lytic murein transglycosylase D
MLSTWATIVCLCLTFAVSAQSFQDSYEAAMEEMKNTHYAPTEESDIELRVLNIDGPVHGVWNEDIRKFILHRLKQSTYTGEIIGRSVMYAPFIEKVLQENDMPIELFYLCLVESQFNTRTVSYAGAAGLWQLMPETARLMGLKVNSYIDERFDPYKSTEAAVKYLKYLHTQLNDWGLAIAGYNMGPGRISNLIKEGKGSNFWELRSYLPRETQNYLPAFIASNYLMQYYPWHNIRPVLPNLDLQLTGAIKLTESISFATISQITALPIATIQTLNPAYRKEFLPENPDGNYLILPKRVIPQVQEYLSAPVAYRASLTDKPIIQTASVNPNSYYERVKITIGADDNVFNLAKAFDCSPSNIRAWNSLSSFYVSVGQQIRIFQPKNPLSLNTDENDLMASVKAKTPEATIAAQENLLKENIAKLYKVDQNIAFDFPVKEPETTTILALTLSKEDNVPPSELMADVEKNLPEGLLDGESETSIAVLVEPVTIVAESTKIENTPIVAVAEPVKVTEPIATEVVNTPVVTPAPVVETLSVVVAVTEPVKMAEPIATEVVNTPIVTPAPVIETPTSVVAVAEPVKVAEPIATEVVNTPVAAPVAETPTVVVAVTEPVKMAEPIATEVVNTPIVTPAPVIETPTVVVAVAEPVKVAEPIATEVVSTDVLTTKGIEETITTVAAVEPLKVAPTPEPATFAKTTNNPNALVTSPMQIVSLKAETIKMESTKEADVSLIAKMEDMKGELAKNSVASTPTVMNDNRPIKDTFAFTSNAVKEAKPVLTITSFEKNEEQKNNGVQYVYHYLGRNETLTDVAEQYEGVCVDDLLALNQLAQNEVLAVGSKIKVKMP